MKGIDEFRNNVISRLRVEDFGFSSVKNAVDISERELTAFDIIALKGVNVGEFKCLVNKDTTYEQYVYFHEHFKELQGGLLTMGNVPLSRQEFNVVKESVLCHW